MQHNKKMYFYNRFYISISVNFRGNGMGIVVVVDVALRSDAAATQPRRHHPSYTADLDVCQINLRVASIAN